MITSKLTLSTYDITAVVFGYPQYAESPQGFALCGTILCGESFHIDGVAKSHEKLTEDLANNPVFSGIFEWLISELKKAQELQERHRKKRKDPDMAITEFLNMARKRLFRKRKRIEFSLKRV